MNNITKAVKIFKKYKCKFTLMHCVSAYPCLEKNINLNMINTLKKKFKVDIGYSGHEKSVSPSLMAACFGANSIERHITLDRTMWGTDQAASLEENGMKNLVELIRKFELCRGDGVKKFLVDEKKNYKKINIGKKYKISCLIPIRSNSKRIKNKNFTKIKNVPLIKFVLQNICKSKYIDDYFIATDNLHKVSKIIKKNNKIRFFLRSKKVLQQLHKQKLL